MLKVAKELMVVEKVVGDTNLKHPLNFFTSFIIINGSLIYQDEASRNQKTIKRTYR